MSLVEISDQERRIAERVDPGAMNALAVSGPAGGVQFASAAQVMEFAKMMSVANSGVRKHLRGNPGACLAICTQAIEWGMSPFAVANKSYFVNEQIAFESQLVQAVILRRAPIKGRIRFDFTGSGDKRICRAWARLKDDGDEIVEYISPEFGKITPKNSPLWKSDPDQQHAYYSGRALCRRHFPDVLLGVYDSDEIAPVGPNRARNVSPPRGLQAKLDMLARAPAHDPETGEVERVRCINDDMPADAGNEQAATAATEEGPSNETGRSAPRQQHVAGAGVGTRSARAAADEVFPGDRPSRLDSIMVARDRGADAGRLADEQGDADQ